MIAYPTAVPTDWTVVCLCAGWCRACESYGSAFARRAAESHDARHVWIDIEEDEQLVGDIDIETFPTLLVLQGERPAFFGAVLPHVDVIDRMLRTLRQPGAAVLPVDAVQRQAVERIAARLRSVRS